MTTAFLPTTLLSSTVGVGRGGCPLIDDGPPVITVPARTPTTGALVGGGITDDTRPATGPSTPMGNRSTSRSGKMRSGKTTSPKAGFFSNHVHWASSNARRAAASLRCCTSSAGCTLLYDATVNHHNNNNNSNNSTHQFVDQPHPVRTHPLLRMGAYRGREAANAPHQ